MSDMRHVAARFHVTDQDLAEMAERKAERESSGAVLAEQSADDVLFGIKVCIDPACPPGAVYFVNPPDGAA